MRYGVIGDIHGNYHALRSVWDALTGLAIDRVLFVGDAVGYGADVNACVRVLAGSAVAGVRGNHDRVVASVTGRDTLNSYAYSTSDVRDGDLWSRKHLTPDYLQWVADLPSGPIEVDGAAILCHGSIQDENEYVTGVDAARRSVAVIRGRRFRSPVCFFGHTHVPVVIENGDSALSSRGSVRLAPGTVYLINPGSVGQPRDGDPRASFGVFDTEEGSYANYRTDYDVEGAQRRILAVGLPPSFAHRLRVGR